MHCADEIAPGWRGAGGMSKRRTGYPGGRVEPWRVAWRRRVVRWGGAMAGQRGGGKKNTRLYSYRGVARFTDKSAARENRKCGAGRSLRE